MVFKDVFCATPNRDTTKLIKNGDAVFVHPCRNVAVWRAVFEK